MNFQDQKNEHIALQFKEDKSGNYKFVEFSITRLEGEESVTKTLSTEDPDESGFLLPCSDGALLIGLAFIRVTIASEHSFGFAPETPNIIFSDSTSKKYFNSFRHLYNDLSRSAKGKGHATQWIRAMLTFPTEGESEAGKRFRDWFSISGTNSTVTFNNSLLTPKRVSIYLNGKPATTSSKYNIESNLAKNLESPLNVSVEVKGVKVYGRPPNVNHDFDCAESDFKILSDIHSTSSEKRIVEIVGDSMTGKTVFSIQWIQRAIAKGQIFHRIFAWTFPNQGDDSYRRHPSSEFFDSIGDMLGLSFQHTEAPEARAIRVASELRKSPSFIFLDGCETTFLNSEGNQAPRHQRDPGITKLLSSLSRSVDSASFVLITTRRSLVPALDLAATSVAKIVLRPMRSPKVSELMKELANDSDVKESILLGNAGGEMTTLVNFNMLQLLEKDKSNHYLYERLLNEGTTLPRPDFQKRGQIESMSPIDRRIFNLFLRNLLELPSRPLYEVICCCDEAVGKDLLFQAASTLTEGNIDWEDALNVLVTCGALEQADINAAKFSVHPKFRHYVRDALRSQSPARWTDINRGLAEAYLKRVPNRYPNAGDEQEIASLCQASSHLCRAGDRTRAYEEICYDRLSRKLTGYIIFFAGCYEAPQKVIDDLLGDVDGAAVSSLTREQETLCVHTYGLSSRFLGDFDRALELERDAWNRAKLINTPNTILPIGFNLLRMSHQFGLLREAKSIQYSMLLQGIRGKVFKGGMESYPPENLIEGASAISAILALSHIYQSKRPILARGILRAGIKDCRSNAAEFEYLLPSFGRPWHALSLLEIGDWKTCEKAFESGEWSTDILRHRQTGTFEALAGKLFLEKTRASKGDIRADAIQEGKDWCESALTLAIEGSFQWWHAFSLITRAELEFLESDYKSAKRTVHEALAINPTSDILTFPLLKVDGLRLLAEIYLSKDRPIDCREFATEAKAISDEIGYGLRTLQIERLISKST